MDILLIDIILEVLRAGVLGALLLILITKGHLKRYAGYSGVKMIHFGFILVFFATIIDITDEIAGMEQYFVFGNTLAEAVLEEIFGYLPGFILILFGLIRLFPAIEAAEKSARQLRESEDRFRTVFDTIPDVVAITRLSDGTVVDINQTYNVLTGFPREDILGRSSLEMGAWVNPSDRERMIEGVREKGFVKDMETPMRTTDGLVRDSLVSARMLILNNESHLLTIFKDITDRNRVVRALEESEKRFRGIFESHPDPVILSRLKTGQILDVNKAFENETGIARLTALGHNSAELGLWGDPGHRDLLLTKLRETGAVDNFESIFRVRDRQAKVGLLSARVVDISNEPCVLIVIRDVSKEKEVERAMIEMDQMKNEFISTAAHELRTPLSAIMGYTELLRNPEQFGPFTQAQRDEFHDVIYEKGEALTRIVDDLLDISRIESGHPVALNWQDVNVEDLLVKVVDRFKIHSNKHEYQIELSQLGRNCMLPMDRQRVIQVLENLISNAVKYSPSGSRIFIRGESNNQGCLITIQDQGQGMTPEQVARVFDKFYRADATDTAVGGLGLGMSIARQIVEAHHGNIWVESSPGAGTKACFILPLRRPLPGHAT